MYYEAAMPDYDNSERRYQGVLDKISYYMHAFHQTYIRATDAMLGVLDLAESGISGLELLLADTTTKKKKKRRGTADPSSWDKKPRPEPTKVPSIDGKGDCHIPNLSGLRKPN